MNKLYPSVKVIHLITARFHKSYELKMFTLAQCSWALNTPLHDAINDEDDDMIDSILSNHNDCQNYLNCRNLMGCTPIMLAVKNEAINLIQRLLELGADPDIPDIKGQTCLMAAVLKDNLELVELFANRDIKSNPEGNSQNISSPLYCAAMQGNADVVKHLLDYGANPNASRVNLGLLSTPLGMALCKGHIQVIKLLLQYGANVAFYSPRCETSLSVLGYSPQSANSLNTRNRDHDNIIFDNNSLNFEKSPVSTSNISSKPNNQYDVYINTRTYFHAVLTHVPPKYTVDLSHTPMPQFNDLGTDVNLTPNGQEYHHMHEWKENGLKQYAYIEYLLKILIASGLKPFIYALKKKEPLSASPTVNGVSQVPTHRRRPDNQSFWSANFAEQVLRNNNNRNSHNHNGENVINSSNDDIIDYYDKIECKPNLEQKSANPLIIPEAPIRLTPFQARKKAISFFPRQTATQLKRTESQWAFGLTLKELYEQQHNTLNYYEYVNGNDTENDTDVLLREFVPLERAKDYYGAENMESLMELTYEAINIIQRLLELGADPDIPDIKGQTCLMAAVLKDNLELVELFANRDIKSNPEGNSQNISSPLYCAAMQGNADIVKHLLDYGANPNASRVNSGLLSTPLGMALCKGHIQVIKLLLQYGANVAFYSPRCETSLSVLGYSPQSANSLNTRNREYDNIILDNNILNFEKSPVRTSNNSSKVNNQYDVYINTRTYFHAVLTHVPPKYTVDLSHTPMPQFNDLGTDVNLTPNGQEYHHMHEWKENGLKQYAYIEYLLKILIASGLKPFIYALKKKEPLSASPTVNGVSQVPTHRRRPDNQSFWSANFAEQVLRNNNRNSYNHNGENVINSSNDDIIDYDKIECKPNIEQKSADPLIIPEAPIRLTPFQTRKKAISFFPRQTATQLKRTESQWAFGLTLKELYQQQHNTLNYYEYVNGNDTENDTDVLLREFVPLERAKDYYGAENMESLMELTSCPLSLSWLCRIVLRGMLIRPDKSGALIASNKIDQLCSDLELPHVLQDFLQLNRCYLTD